MASKNYPNNACCYYVSWENIPLTGSLFLLENLVFLIIWAYDLQTTTILSKILTLYILSTACCQIFSNSSCKSCENCSSYYTKTFESIYEKVNSGCDWIRKNSQGSKAVQLGLVLLCLRTLNISVFCMLWVAALWSFASPAASKFLGLDLCEVCEEFRGPIGEKFKAFTGMIPKAASVRKNQ